MKDKRSNLGDNIGRGRRGSYEREWPEEDLEDWIEKPNQEHKTGTQLVWFTNKTTGKIRGIIAAARHSGTLREYNRKLEEEVAEAYRRFSGNKYHGAKKER